MPQVAPLAGSSPPDDVDLQPKLLLDLELEVLQHPVQEKVGTQDTDLPLLQHAAPLELDGSAREKGVRQLLHQPLGPG